MLIIIMAPWNYLQTPGASNDDVPLVSTEVNLDTSDADTESSETVPKADSIPNVEMDSAMDQPMNSAPIVPDSTPAPIIEEPENNEVTNEVAIEPQPASTSVTYVSTGGSGGGHGHRSSSSGNSNSGDAEQDDTTDQSDGGSGGNNGVPQEPDDGIDEDDSFFVLPESPIGSVLILATSLGSMGGFLAYRAKRMA
jgi:hypothetical protein